MTLVPLFGFAEAIPAKYYTLLPVSRAKIASKCAQEGEMRNSDMHYVMSVGLTPFGWTKSKLSPSLSLSLSLDYVCLCTSYKSINAFTHTQCGFAHLIVRCDSIVHLEADDPGRYVLLVGARQY
jgi:hypothetical protein